MYRNIQQHVGCLVVVAWMTIMPLPRALAFPSRPTPSPTTHPVIHNVESFLVDLNNGLIDRGVLNGPKLYVAAVSTTPTPTPSADGEGYRRDDPPVALWDGLNAPAMLQAMDAFFGSQSGGFVSSKAVFRADAAENFSYTEDGLLGLTFPDPQEALWLGYRRGLLGCEIEPVSAQTPNAGLVIENNTQCIFASFVRGQYLAQQPDELSLDFVLSSGVSAELTNYLSGLEQSGVVSDFSLDLEQGRVDFHLSPQALTRGADIGGTTFSLSMINTHSTLENEASDFLVRTQALAEDYFVYPQASGGLWEISNTTLRNGLTQVAQVGRAGGAQKQEAFLKGVGLEGYAKKIWTALVPCSEPYPGGLITPCNKQVAVLWGHDPLHPHGPYSTGGFQGTRAALTAYGYDVQEIDARSNMFPAADTNRFELLRKAQVLIFNTHGMIDGGMGAQLYRNITAFEEYGTVPIPPNLGPTEECCNMMKQTAVSLGLAGAAGINCTNRPRPWQDPTGSVTLTAGTAIIIAYNAAGNPYVANRIPNRCEISVYPNLLLNVGTKAALFTAQCYGGRIPERIAQVAGSFMDFVGQTIEPNTADVEKCDDEILARDIRGEAQYCRKNPAPVPPPPYREPWEGAAGGSCANPLTVELFPNPENALRTVQGSVSARPAYGAGTSLPDCHDEFMDSGDGLKRYNAASPGGDPTRIVEFAPQVTGASFNAGTGTFSASFSSKVYASAPKVELVSCEVSGRHSSLYSPGGQPKFSSESNSVSFDFIDGDPPIMDANEWYHTTPADMRRRYDGHDQNNWPWYVKVQIEAMAPNTIKMVGNQGASSKWIWGNAAFSPLDEPWRFTNGNLGSGGNKFEVRIPCRPPMVCCMPQVEYQACAHPDHSGDMFCKKNGCVAVEGVSRADCVADSFGYIGINCGKIYCGSWHFPWYETCKGQETNCDYSVLDPPDGGCPGATLTTQYTKWPISSGAEPKKCSPMELCFEATPPCPDPDPNFMIGCDPIPTPPPPMVPAF